MRLRVPNLDLNVRDAHAYGGLALAAWGGWQVSPAWTCIGLGLTLFAMGLFLQRRAG